MKLGIIIFIVVIIGAIGTGFVIFSGDEQIDTISTEETDTDQDVIQDTGQDAVQETEEIPEEVIDWRDYELTDVNTGETFKISDFKGTPILLESFAVWCPTCTRQQQEIRKLHDEIGDSFISISLDTDPNENAAKVIDHTERNGFDWRYAISPSELTIALIDEFGVVFVNAPQAPMAFIDKDQNAELLRNGVKSSGELKSKLEF